MRDFAQAKLDSEMNACFLSNEHGDLYFLLHELGVKSSSLSWKINNGNWTGWGAICSQIIRIISKSNEWAVRVQVEITSLISGQNCTTRSLITTLLHPFRNCAI